MTALIIVGAVLFLILAILFIPVNVKTEYKEELMCKISFAGITVYKYPATKKANPPKAKREKSASKSQKKENTALRYFKNIKEKQGFASAVKSVMSLFGDILSRLKWVLPHIKFKKLKLGITVGSDDAAKTAFDYGLVCNAVYPVTAFLDIHSNIGFKEINISADFEKDKCDFTLSATVKAQIFYLLIVAFKILFTLKKFVTENCENER